MFTVRKCLLLIFKSRNVAVIVIGMIFNLKILKIDFYVSGNNKTLEAKEILMWKLIMKNKSRNSGD